MASLKMLATLHAPATKSGAEMPHATVSADLGQIVEVDEPTAAWLIQKGYAEAVPVLPVAKPKKVEEKPVEGDGKPGLDGKPPMIRKQ